MKKLKIVAAIFLITFIMSMFEVKADSYLGFINVSIPTFAGNYTTDYQKKTTHSSQYIKKSSDAGTIGARLENVTTYYVTTEKDKYVKLFSDNAGLGDIPANYQLSLRNDWSVLKTNFTGMWILDDFLL